MFTCNVWPAQTWYPLGVGTIVESIGIGLITWAVSTRKVPLVNGMMAVAGAGTGMRFMPGTLHAAGVWPDQIAPAMSVMRFSVPFGGTLALAIMGSVFNNKMAPVFRSTTPGENQHIDTHAGQSLNSIGNLPEAVQIFVRNTGKDAVMWAFIAITPIMAISLVAVFFLGNVWIKSDKAKEAAERAKREGTHDDDEIVSSEVIDKPYIWALLTVSFLPGVATIDSTHPLLNLRVLSMRPLMAHLNIRERLKRINILVHHYQKLRRRGRPRPCLRKKLFYAHERTEVSK